ncbi:Sedlin, N-terminal conserved region-domain-containing protein [Lipomyces arxii]|uniref:Sedlin, N-terminal conserved region-domain-containing protein n=1 Tax=Lipomyces arxii TaxID=56418 RepID=UPI0034CF2A77
MVSSIRMVAFMGRENNPLYIKNFESSSNKLKYHFLAHISLDVFSSRLLLNKSLDSDFGLLLVQDGMALYGWMTNTGIKIVLGFGSGEVIGSEIRSIFRALHFAYISLVCNPFYTLDERKSITSVKFDLNVSRVVNAWNGTMPLSNDDHSVENVVMSYSNQSISETVSS